MILLIAGPDPGRCCSATPRTGNSEATRGTRRSSAREQVDYEYEEAIGEWIHVPPDVEDAHAYAVQYAAERLDDR